MFKKLKDKLAEEVKSSPQRIQQFAQAAQAAVTSASSSISDITNSDLFSIGDNDGQNSSLNKLAHPPNSHLSTYQDLSLGQTPMDSMEYSSGHDIIENQRQRRLSNSSFASDISFRLPSYETPSMFHLQSDIEVSASEAEERGFSGSNVSLERVTKEQLYAAYRRTQERYKKYRTQYGDLARHYKLLEKENAKARSVLVETQDKALRRISELREQCALEQSAKAHIEKTLRVEIEEKNMKIDALNAKVQILQKETNADKLQNVNTDKNHSESDCEVQLINLSNENEPSSQKDEVSTTEGMTLNKYEKMEQLLCKYKESLKTSKEKNSQIVNELQVMSKELENKNKEIDNLKVTTQELIESNKKIQELNNINEELQNKINAFDFAKSKEVSELEIDLLRAKDEIEELQNKIAVYNKREEDYAISLAENKLSIHKELENKEAEIKSLKDNLATSKKEIQSLNIIINDYKSSLTVLEEDQKKFSTTIDEIKVDKTKIKDLEITLQDTTKKCSQLEFTKSKLEEDYKCLELQLKQENAEKLAMIDRNVYLENRNLQISEEYAKKNSHINVLENELIALKKRESNYTNANEKEEILEELNIWKSKYEKLELEIQEERIELVKLQSEIEKLLINHEIIQSQNTEFHNDMLNLKSENVMLKEQVLHYNEMKNTCKKLVAEITELRQFVKLTANEASSLQRNNYETLLSFNQQVNEALNQFINREIKYMTAKENELQLVNKSLQNELTVASKQYADLVRKINEIQEQNAILKSTNQNLELANTTLNEKLNALSNQHEATVKNLERVISEKENLHTLIKDNESKFNDLQASLELEQSNQLDFNEKTKLLENENKTLLQNNNSLEEEILNLKSQIENITEHFNKNIEELLNSKSEISKDVIEKTDELRNKKVILNELEEKVKLLTRENISLETQAQNIACNVKDLESEINDVRVSHAAIVVEKNRLSSFIEQLENKGNSMIEQKTGDTQTEDNIENTILTKEIATLEVSEQNYLLKNQTLQLSSQNETKKYKNYNEISNNYESLKIEHEILKVENKRLQSDIEGLQSYLTKISKENSILNDKLRELIATSEHSTENDITSDLEDLRNEIKLGKDKIENLLRENTLLVEENLELKDQLHAQNYTKSIDENKSFSKNENNGDLSDYKEKYNNLLQNYSKLEKKLHDFEHTNNSVRTDMQQAQEKNEKLKSSNEKLERRLDEALVSLRHLHSLQENTELEYLRNILFEYLTGPGIHSITLAKVLSAIVKFDDSQTTLVLQKEKERQGFMRQLGL